MLRAAGAVIIENNKILLVREDKPYGSELFMLPGGKEEPTVDATLEDTVRREVREEVGLEIEIEEHIIDIMAMRLSNKNEQILLAHYKAKRVTEKITPGDEILEWDWFPIDTLPENCAPNIANIIEIYKQRYDI